MELSAMLLQSRVNATPPVAEIPYRGPLPSALSLIRGALSSPVEILRDNRESLYFNALSGSKAPLSKTTKFFMKMAEEETDHCKILQ